MVDSGEDVKRVPIAARRFLLSSRVLPYDS